MYVYIDDKNIFDARTVFVGMSLFNIMRLPTVLMPLAVAYVCQLWVGLQRISKYLNSDDLDPYVTHSPSESKILDFTRQTKMFLNLRILIV